MPWASEKRRQVKRLPLIGLIALSLAVLPLAAVVQQGGKAMPYHAQATSVVATMEVPSEPTPTEAAKDVQPEVVQDSVGAESPTPTPGILPTPQDVRPASGAPASGFEPNVERWRGVAARFMAPENVDATLSVMTCESHGDPNAGEDGDHFGLLQVSKHWHQEKADALFGAGADLKDPVVNMAVAAVISNRGYNWNAWTCKPGLG